MAAAHSIGSPEFDCNRAEDASVRFVHMTNRKLKLGAICCGTVAVLLGLVALGVEFGSDWSTFIPDIIIGVVGAAIIGVLISTSDRRMQEQRERLSDQRIAYNALLDALSDLRSFSMYAERASDKLPVLVTRMIQLAETVDSQVFAVWLEAERQLCLSATMKVTELSAPLDPESTVDEHIAAVKPLMEWIGEFANNIRYWQLGKLTEPEMAEQAKRIETLLRARNQWRSSPLPWRKEFDTQPDPKVPTE